MTTRRQFLVRAPLGAAGVLAAAKQADAEPPSSQAQQQPGLPAPRPLIANLPSDAATLQWTPKHTDLVYTFGGQPPKQRIKSKTRIVTWTEDCFDGAVKTAADLPSKVMTPGHDNPQTGPFFIEGAEPGDTVAVHIRKLDPARNYAVSSFAPQFGAIVGTTQTAMLAPDLPEKTWRYDVDAARNVATTKSADGRHSWSVPMSPFLGCMGVAPASGEARSTIVPGTFGGNMDCWEVRAGNTLFLGVNVPGALLSFGDGHYAMGEGEIMGAAVEGALNVEVYVELQKKVATPIPRIENMDEIMFVGSGRPLEDAARVAFKSMVQWVQAQTKMSEMDAYQFVSQNSRAPIIQLVDPEYTVLVKLLKSRLPR
ncbi:MAG TPA: acetamidase/formamidase family protein [Gemmatimonadaceae bacterium]|jgi:acetamidase/formamidase